MDSSSPDGCRWLCGLSGANVWEQRHGQGSGQRSLGVGAIFACVEEPSEGFGAKRMRLCSTRCYSRVNLEQGTDCNRSFHRRWPPPCHAYCYRSLWFLAILLRYI